MTEVTIDQLAGIEDQLGFTQLKTENEPQTNLLDMPVEVSCFY